MIVMKMEELIKSYSVCGIYSDSSFILPTDFISRIWRIDPRISCLAFCTLNNHDIHLAGQLFELRKQIPLLRIAIISNEGWYCDYPIKFQSLIHHCQDDADILIPCELPKEDRYSSLLFCSDLLLVHCSMENVIEGRKNNQRTRILRI